MIWSKPPGNFCSMLNFRGCNECHFNKGTIEGKIGKHRFFQYISEPTNPLDFPLDIRDNFSRKNVRVSPSWMGWSWCLHAHLSPRTRCSRARVASSAWWPWQGCQVLHGNHQPTRETGGCLMFQQNGRQIMEVLSWFNPRDYIFATHFALRDMIFH